MEQNGNKALWVILITLWIAISAGGLALLDCRAATRGTQANAPRTIAADNLPAGSHAPYQLILFLHPQCPCSRATVNELTQIAARLGDQAKITIYFWIPPTAKDSWQQSSLWVAASHVPGAQLVADDNGIITQHFNAHTSGQTMLYSPDGRLLFSGGITPSRGHEGDNDGESATLDAVLIGHANRADTPVFGCSFTAPK
jgi:hypothetical protein